MERRGNRFGTLVSKGVGKPWLAKWVCHGKTYYKTTGEVDRKRALKVLEKLTRPFREDDEATIISNLEMMLRRLKSSATSHKKLEVSAIWSEFAKTMWQSDVVDGTSRVYEAGMNHMQKWMDGKVLEAAGIDVKLAELYLKELSTTIGASTFNTRLSLFKRVWHNLPSEYGLDKTVWDSFKKKKVEATSARQALTVEELGKVVAKAPTEDIKLLLLIGIYTGMRIGDCANLKWSEIDLNNNTMRVVPQKTKKHMAAPVTIPIHPTLKTALLEVKDKSSEHVSEANAHGYVTGNINNQVIDLFKKCGLKTSCKIDGKVKLLKGFHSLRHTFVSMAINNGMSPMLVQRIVGHSTVNMTDHYFHENAEKASEGIAQMPDIVDIAQKIQASEAH